MNGEEFEEEGELSQMEGERGESGVKERSEGVMEPVASKMRGWERVEGSNRIGSAVQERGIFS